MGQGGGGGIAVEFTTIALSDTDQIQHPRLTMAFAQSLPEQLTTDQMDLDDGLVTVPTYKCVQS